MQRDKILIVEDDAFLRDGLVELLERESYLPAAADSLQSARTLLIETDFSLILLDVMLPDGTGFNFCAELRENGFSAPILFLTACDDELQIVRGLDCGGDDYVTKPFKLRELTSRIRALLRRAERNAEKKPSFLNAEKLTADVNGEEILLTPTEFQLLSVLVKNAGVIVPRGTLLERIWDIDGDFIDDNTLTVHVSRLRDKIGKDRIETVRGVGYRYTEK
ncbi:MAG: response regulator transcription factor [Clostridia bacterium]|nr:response regulator transcription factor [Clostridia bacterium]